MLPIGLQQLLQQDLIGSQTCDLAFNLIDLLGPNLIQTHDNELCFSFQHTWDLFGIKPPCLNGEPSTEMIVAQALQVYCIRLLGPRGVAGLVPRSGRWHLTTALQESICIRTVAEEEAIFWAWTVALDVWKSAAGQLSKCGVALRDLHAKRFAWLAPVQIHTRVLNEYFCDPVLIETCTVSFMEGDLSSNLTRTWANSAQQMWSQRSKGL